MASNSKIEESIKVFLRIRPPISKEVQHETAISPMGLSSINIVSENKECNYNYDQVFGEITAQEDIFEKVKPALVDVLSGINSCIFAYGQTSSGKSFTMIGPNGGQDIVHVDKSQWGILPRASEFLLGYLNSKSEEGLLTFEVKASFLQIYNEDLYDLLRDSGPKIEDRLLPSEKDQTDLKIREVPKPKRYSTTMTSRDDMPREVYVSGLSEFRVETSDDILKILAFGTSNRMTRSTDFNLTSSRSHALLQLTFEIESQVDSGQTVISRSKLNLIDLAGSEKIPYTSADANNPKHMKELTSINKSLSSLGNVISALTSKTRSHIPYRDSKLTRILQDSLGGNTRTILIACVAPTVLHTSETMSTLQFAERVKNVRITVKANTIVDDKYTLAKAQAEITRLKSLLGHALRQLEEKGGGLTPSVKELDQLVLENERLKRENESLKRLTHSRSQSSLDGDGMNYEASPSKSGKRDNKKKAGFMSSVDRYGNKLPSIDTPKPLKSRSKSVGISNADSEGFNSDGDNESIKGKNTRVKSSRVPKRASSFEVNNIGNSSSKESKNKLHNSLYSDIKARQVAELNLLIEEATKKIQDQYSTAAKQLQEVQIQSQRSMYSSSNSVKNVVESPKTEDRPLYPPKESQEPMHSSRSVDSLNSYRSNQNVPTSSRSQQGYSEYGTNVYHASTNLSKQVMFQLDSQPQFIKNPSSQKLRPLNYQSNQHEDEEISEALNLTRSNALNADAELPDNRIYIKKSTSQLPPVPESSRSNKVISSQQFANVSSNGLDKQFLINSSMNTSTKGNNSENKPANLSNSKDDIGRMLELFSFRKNLWERIDLIDFDDQKRSYKCAFPDGGIQWLDLTKKPVRSLPDEV